MKRYLVVRLLLFFSFTIVVSAEVRIPSQTNMVPDNGSHFNWIYVPDQKVLFFPVLRSSALGDVSNHQLDSLRSEGLTHLRSAFPQIQWDTINVFPANKKGELSRSRAKLSTMVPFVAEQCSSQNSRSGLVARISATQSSQGIPIFQCEMVLIDSEAGCAVAMTKGWADTEAGMAKALEKAADLLTEQHLYVIRPKIDVEPLLDEKGKRVGASIPVGSRVGVLEKSLLILLGTGEQGVLESVGTLTVEEEGVSSSTCKISGIRDKDNWPAAAICMPVDDDAFKEFKPAKKSKSTGR